MVKEVSGDDVICEVLNGGMLGEHQGINLPGTNVSIPSLTEKDEADLAFGLKHAVDVVAISFVRTAEDVVRARRAIAARGGVAPVIAKLEKPQAIDNLEAILEVANGVMVARGDLGVEVAPEKVPLIQKHVIRRALDFRKPVITATQMLESMTENPRPTRAEASDVANAIFDGTDAVMLSGESAVGKFPREAVEMMARIVAEAEAHPFHPLLPEHRPARRLSIAETICESMAHAARDLNIRAIAVFTETANTARMLSKYRPAADIYAFTPFEAVCNRMNLLWGVTPLRCPAKLSAANMAEFAEQELLRLQALSPGDVFGLIAGTTRTVGRDQFHATDHGWSKSIEAAKRRQQVKQGGEKEMADEILSMAVLEALPGKEEELLSTLRELYTLMNAKGYCRDSLHRDSAQPDRFLHLRHWKSPEMRAEAQVDPEVHRYWLKLPELCTIPTVYESLEKVFES